MLARVLARTYPLVTQNLLTASQCFRASAKISRTNGKIASRENNFV